MIPFWSGFLFVNLVGISSSDSYSSSHITLRMGSMISSSKLLLSLVMSKNFSPFLLCFIIYTFWFFLHEHTFLNFTMGLRCLCSIEFMLLLLTLSLIQMLLRVSRLPVTKYGTFGLSPYNGTIYDYKAYIMNFGIS